MSTGQRRESGAAKEDDLWGKTLRVRADRDWGEGRRGREPRAGVHKSGATQQGLEANSPGGTPVRLDCYLQGREPVKIRVNKDIFR